MANQMRRIVSTDSLYDFIGYVVLCAPDDFPYEDYLPKDDQMTLQRAFHELHESIGLLDPRVTPPEKREMLAALLHQSLAAYERGEQRQGAHILQDFQDQVFERRNRMPE